MVDTGEDEGFKVTDRRRRADEVVEQPRSPEPSGEAPQEAAADSAPVTRERPPSELEPSGGYGTQERDLTGLFMMLASSAVVALGEAADPLTGEVRREPAHAAETIDLLILLREKTEGNRTPEETQLLEAIIYDLQMRYINALKRA